MADSRASVVSLSAGSEPVYDVVCNPCYSDGKIAEADGYCHECCEHLCVQCIGFHKKLSSLKHHKIQNKESMPTKPGTPQFSDACTERCRIHKDEIIKYFCPVHKVLGCGVCVTLKHALCDDVSYIPEIVPGLEDSRDYKEFMTKLHRLIQKSKYTVKFAEKGKKQASDCHEKAIQEIDTFRQELMNDVDKHVKELKDRARHIHTQDTGKMDSLADNSNEVLVELQSVSSDMSSKQGKKHFCQMFVEIKNKDQRLTELQGKLEGMTDNDIPGYYFQSDKQVSTMIRRQNGLGQLVMIKPLQQRKATHVADISGKNPRNPSWCNIVRVALLSPERLVLVASDRGYFTIKLIDIPNKKIISQFKPEKDPWDVTVCRAEVVATLPDASKIIFLKCDKGLVHVRDVSVNGDCTSIDCADGKLFVLYGKEKKLEIMTVTGTILHRVERNDQGAQLGWSPRYITVSAANESIYVSHEDQRPVTVLSLDGNVKDEYRDDQLESASQLTADSAGVMYLLNSYNRTIHLLSPLCQKVKVLLSHQQKRALSVCYCENTRRLYVGMWNYGDIEVYQVY